VKAVLEWNPQLVVDAHEMGSEGTFLFSPPNEPYNPNLTETLKKWWKVFARDQAKAFDRYGWSYYTREWYEGWYPGYGSEWIAFLGGVAILYEQAGVAPSFVKQPDGSSRGSSHRASEGFLRGEEKGDEEQWCFHSSPRRKSDQGQSSD